MDTTAVEFVDAAGAHDGRAAGFQIGSEIRRVVLGLKPDEVEGGERADGFGVLGQRQQNIGRRAGNVQEEADRIVVSGRPQFPCKAHQMVVVHPHDVVRAQEARHLICEIGIDADVAGEVRACVFRKIGPIVQHRPQHAVGEAVVIFMIVRRGEIERHVVQILALDHLRGDGRILGHAAAPAAPYALATAQRGLHSDHEPARLPRSGKRDAIRDDHQPRHHASSQRFDRCMAELMTPAME